MLFGDSLQKCQGHSSSFLQLGVPNLKLPLNLLPVLDFSVLDHIREIIFDSNF